MRILYILHDMSGHDDNHYYLSKELAQQKADYLNKEQEIETSEIEEIGWIVQEVELNTNYKCLNCPNIAADKDSICLSCYHK